MSPLRSFGCLLAFVCAVLVAILVHDAISPAKPLLNTPRTDFTTFYCAGLVARDGFDPYHVEPLRACEHRLGEFGAPGRAAWEVIPAPFPGYAIALFALVSLLPFTIAHVVWFAALLFAVGATAWALHRLTGFALVPLVAIVAAIIAFWNLVHGEPTPLVAALLALGAERARRGAWSAAGVLVGAAMIVPQLVMPAFVALLIFAPRARTALLATGAVLAVVSVAMLGVAENVEYFTQTLPLHAASEVHLASQFSATHVLGSIGVPDRTAIVLGQFAYVVMTATGIWTAVRLARANDQPACLVLVPPAIASIGGSFSHDVQVMTAVSATILVAALPAVPRVLAVVPLMLFSVFWNGDAAWRGMLVVTALSALAALWLASDRLGLTRARRGAFIFVTALVLAGSFTALQRVPVPGADRSLNGLPAPAIRPDDNASRLWAYRNSLPAFAAFDEREESQKLPLVAGIVALIGCALAARRRADSPNHAAGVSSPGASARTSVS